MKKILFIIFSCGLLGACQVDELTDLKDINEIYARIECDVETKTSMDADNNIRWSEGDQLIAFMKSSLGLKYQVKSDYVGKTFGGFTKISSAPSDDLYAGVEFDHNVVYYPYSDDVHIEKSGENYTLNVVLPVEQTYCEGSFSNGSMPMLAVSEGNDIIFKNVCGGIKLKIKGNKKITSIKFDGKNNERLSGPATVTAYTDGTRPSIEMGSDAASSVTLDCGAGVQLRGSDVTEFIIALPPVAFKQGFTVSITDSEANTYKVESSRANSVRRSSLLVMPVITIGESGSDYPEYNEPEEIKGHNTVPYFSETVELMGMIWRMAGSNEYNQCKVATVTNSADEHFASMKYHQAIKLAAQYQRQNICFDAVAGYANQLIFNEEGDLIFDPDYLDGSNGSFDDRWNYKQKSDMLAAVNDFYRKSNFHEWFVSTRAEQQQAIASFKSVCNMDYTWIDSFYGKDDKISSRIILSFMAGSHNYGISLKRQDASLLLTPVYGSLSQFGEEVQFNGDVNLIVHEFSHPYCNPLIEDNWSAISEKVETIYKSVEHTMESQDYGQPLTMMCETLVRAAAIRYMISHNQKDLVENRLSYEEHNGFIMVRSLVKTLEEREINADKYATLADFMPVMIEAINKFDPKDPANLGPAAEPDLLPHDYVDLGIDMADGRKLYFATRNVGETSPGGIGSFRYPWGARIESGSPWYPYVSDGGSSGPIRLDAAHDIATITWGEKWHVPSPDEWRLLINKCDYERKESNESGYGVAGYFFYNKSDHSKSIFLPVSRWSDELEYWTSELVSNYNSAFVFESNNGYLSCGTSAGIQSTGFAIRPVFVE